MITVDNYPSGPLGWWRNVNVASTAGLVGPAELMLPAVRVFTKQTISLEWIFEYRGKEVDFMDLFSSGPVWFGIASHNPDRGLEA